MQKIGLQSEFIKFTYGKKLNYNGYFIDQLINF